MGKCVHWNGSSCRKGGRGCPNRILGGCQMNGITYREKGYMTPKSLLNRRFFDVVPSVRYASK